jgi:cystathionine gamma-synthase
VLANLDIPLVPTLGDVSTIISHPASSSQRALTPEARAAIGISEGFIRVSVGIEVSAMLEEDYGQTSAAMRSG